MKRYIGFWKNDPFKAKNGKILCNSQYRLAKISSLGLNDSSEVGSSDNDDKMSPIHDVSEMGEKSCLILEA